MKNPNPDLKLAVIFESDDPVAFRLVQSALEEADIEFVASEGMPAGYGFSPMINPLCTIQVASSSEAEAREITANLFSGTSEATDDLDGGTAE